MVDVRLQIRLLCVLIVFLFAGAACKKKERASEEVGLPVPEVAGGIEIIDARGKPISLKHPAIQIVSLLPSLTEYICQLDKGHLMVGRSEWCKYPLEALDVPVVGSLNKVDDSKISRLTPDVVLVSALMPDNQIEHLESLGTTVIVFDHQNWGSICRDLEVLGKVLGASGDVKTLIAWLERHRRTVANELNSIEDTTPIRTAVLYSLDPLSSAGKNTFIDEFISLSGGVNVAADLPSNWPTLTVEELIQRQPEVLLISSEVEASVDSKAKLAKLTQDPHWSQLPALKNNRVYILDADTLTVPGPRQVVALAQIAAALHPELFDAPVGLRHLDR
jgi:iron complex transport system substrate-binding protein